MTFKTHDFCGTTIYECPYCPFDDEKPGNVKVHIARVHPERLPAPPPPTVRAPEATLYTSDGAVVTEIPISAADCAAEMSSDIIPSLGE